MNMETKKTRWGWWVLCLGIGLGGVWGCRPPAGTTNNTGPAAKTGLPPVPVVAGHVVQKDVPIYLDGLGTVQAFNAVTVHVRVDGELKKVAFAEGQDVKAGDVLAQIDPDPFRAQLDQAEAKQTQDEAQLANARLDLQRDAEQIAAKIVSQQVYDTQKAVVDQLAAQVKADQAAINSAKVQLNYTTVVSPLEGRTGVRLVDQGNIVHANDANGLVLVTQLKPISVVFTLPEQMLPAIQKEHAAGEIEVVAVDRDNRTPIGQGKLTVIDNQIDVTTGTIRLKATFPNEDLRLWPGQFVNARLLLTTCKNGLVVPAAVVQRGPDGPYAFVIKLVKEDQIITNREGKIVTTNLEYQVATIQSVKVAQIENGMALIDEGLSVGDQVVVDGQYRLQPGAKVMPAGADKPASAGKSTPADKPVAAQH